MALNEAWEKHFRATAPRYMLRLLKDFPELGDLDAAAIFGNAGHESKGLTDDQEDAPVVKGSRGGLNWMQWTGPRRRDMEAYCARHGFDPASDEAAYKWLFLELKGDEKNAIPAIKRAKTLRGKVEAFEKAFLRAGVKHYNSRFEWAVVALDALTKTPAAPEAPTAPKPSPGTTTPPKPTLPRTESRAGGLAALIIGALVVIGGAIIAFFQNGGSP